MLEYNRREYEYICEQIDSEYKSIITYTAIIATFSAAIFAALARIDTGNPDYEKVIEHVMLTLANVTLLILFLINYKASAYNRLIGYRQILTSEHFNPEFAPPKSRKAGEGRRFRDEMQEHAVSYDVCMEHLNHVYDTRKFEFEPVNGEFFDRRGVFGAFDQDTGSEALDRYISRGFPRWVRFVDRDDFDSVDAKRKRHDAEVTKVPLLTHIMLIFLMIGWHEYGKGSWRFASYVNRIVLYLVIVEVSVSAFVFWNDDSFIVSVDADEKSVLVLGSLALQAVFLLSMLHIISVYWQELTFGRRRSFSFFLQFLPFRMIYLMNMYDIDKKRADEEGKFKIRPYYMGMPWKIDRRE